MSEAATEPLDAPFDQYQRYQVTSLLARAMAFSGGRAPVVLDVGGSHADFSNRWRRPIAEFLPECRTVTLDLAANTTAGYVRGRGDALPFGPGAFDLVCSVDVLEHVPPPARARVLEEATRVASRAVVVAAPFRSPEVERAEALVSGFIRRACGYEQGQLREHRELGWPDLADTARTLADLGWTSRVFPYGSVWRWCLMMIDKHALEALAGGRRLQTRLDRAYNEEHFADDRDKPCYRHFIVATRRPDDALLAWAGERFQAAVPTGVAAPVTDVTAVERLFDLLAVHARNQELQVALEPARRAAHVEEAEAHRVQMVEALKALQAENERLSALLRSVEQSSTFRLAGWARHLLRRQS